MSQLKIRDVRTIMTAPNKLDLVVVKVETSEPGLYGLGCATFAYRSRAVKTAVDEYLKPLLTGRDPQRIEDLWQMSWLNSYWRNGPVLNNAISGVDMALWDIKGKLANMPVYQLLGGKCREAAAIYRHASGSTFEEVEESARAILESGCRHVRCQIGSYGGPSSTLPAPENCPQGQYYDPAGYARAVPLMFEYLREKLGDDVELLHDVHERVPPVTAMRIAKDLEQFRLFYLEDLLPPEQVDWFEQIRNQTCTALAMGEIFNNPNEWKSLVSRRLIDFIRVHISQIGGLTPARKLATLCEQFGVRTAWHGPGDVSPVGHAANVHLDLSVPNFGIQEWCISTESEKIQEIFPGCPQRKAGYVYLNDKPGLGIDIDEKAAARFPCIPAVTTWTQTRLPDGSMTNP